jgi:hypothetical protein
VGSLLVEFGGSWGSSCLVCCYGSPASQAGRRWRKVPPSCVEDFSVKWGLGKRSRDLRTSGLGAFILHCEPKLPCPTIWRVHRLLCPLGLDLTKQNRLPWLQGLTLNTRSHGVVVSDWQGWKEVTRRPRHLFTWHQFFSDLHDTLHHRNECLKKLPHSPVFAGIHEVLVLLKDTLLRGKPRNSFTS